MKQVKNVLLSVQINEVDTEGRTALHVASCEGARPHPHLHALISS